MPLSLIYDDAMPPCHAAARVSFTMPLIRFDTAAADAVAVDYAMMPGQKALSLFR